MRRRNRLSMTLGPFWRSLPITYTNACHVIRRMCRLRGGAYTETAARPL